MQISKVVSSLLLTSVVLFTGCSNDQAAASGDEGGKDKEIIDGGVTLSQALSLDFTSITVPTSQEDKKRLLSLPTIKVGSKVSDLSYHEVVKTGYADNGEIFGAVKDKDGKLITFSDGSPYLCNGTNEGSGSGLDFSAILQKDDKLFMVSQFECSIGAMYMMEVEQSESGIITPKENTLEYIPQGEHGGWTHCAGSITPWESHLGSEEYETNARKIETKGNDSDKYFSELRYFWGDEFSSISPYFYGWITETKIESSSPSYVKHYAMGRLSHEMAYVMPDEKTVYMSDDGGNTGFFMFIADVKGDLSAGTLYAAKFTQTANFRGGAFDLTWIDLGHSSDTFIKSTVDSAPKFSDIFEASAPLCASTCEEGFTSVNTSAGQECLKVKEGKEEIASRLETRRYAAIKGATTELNKAEGIDYDPIHNRLYLAISNISKAMEDNSAKDFGGYNDIRLPKNSAGAVYAIDLDKNDGLNSDYIAKNFYSIVFGENKDYKGTEFEGNRDDLDKISNPDNLTYIPNTNTLIIAEDSGSHTNNMMWAYDVETDKLRRLATLPVGAEATSTAFYRDINGYSYLSLVTQHPKDDKESTYGLFALKSDLANKLVLPSTQTDCETIGMDWDGNACHKEIAKIDYSIAASNDIVKVAQSSCYTQGNGIVFGSNFECGLMQPWQAFSSASSADWVLSSYGGSSFAYISGYGADEPSKDWLISPKLTLSGDEVLNFKSAKGYSGSVIVVKISADYTGSGDPFLATWTDLNASIATTDEGNYKWTDSGDVNLSAYTGDVYIAFYHEAAGTSGGTVANWEVDDVVISGSGTAIIPFQAAFTLSKKSVLTDEYIEVKSSISGGKSPYVLTWDMGNTETKSESSFCYKYPSDGNYTISLSVVDGEDATTVTSDKVIVNAPLDEKVPAKSGDLRIATYNAYLNRATLGKLYTDLNSGNDQQVKNVANIIQQVNPDVILINEFDYNGSDNVDLLKSKYLNVPQGLGEAIDYPYYFVAESNTGIQSGKDYNKDGKIDGNDAFGFGDFAGQYGMVILSKYPIDTANVRTFQTFLWKDMPNYLIPMKEGAPYFSDEVMNTYRLSSKSHWDVPVTINGKVFHVLADHPTPPVFDDGDKDGKNGGAEDASIIDWNGLRNSDEIRLWADYVKGASYIYDDKAVSGGLDADSRFVILGDHNADNDEGDGYKNPILQLLDNPFVNSSVTPTSKGALSEDKKNLDEEDTSDFRLRADYVLPSTYGFEIAQCGIYWPELTDKKHYLVEKNSDGGENSSDHRLVWCDLNITDTNSSSAAVAKTFKNCTPDNTSSSASSSLIISEYIEGSSSNKAIELYNAGDTDICLGEYNLSIYSNGSSTSTIERSIDSVILTAGQTFVISEPSASDELKAYTDQITDKYLGFNGDDAVSIVHMATGSLVDVIGKIGEDPGKAWVSGAITTKDHTIRRKVAITTGDTDGSDDFDPAVQWDGFAKNTFDGLGIR